MVVAIHLSIATMPAAALRTATMPAAAATRAWATGIVAAIIVTTVDAGRFFSSEFSK
jgi:hypothetical protein